MFPPMGLELVICLIAIVVVIAIAILVFNAVRSKPDKSKEINLQAVSSTDAIIEEVINASTPTEPAVTSQNGLATTSLVVSILAILVYILFGPTWSNCLGPIAMIIGAIALLQIRKHGGKGKGVAIMGIGLGTLPFIITLVTTMILMLMHK